ncbi:MAG: GNAT family N-acetyltransferase [Paracoccaceae bacterium]
MSLAFDIPVIETERLILRGPRESDFEAAAAFGASPRAKFVGGSADRWENWRGFLAVIGHWALRGYGFWTLEEKETGAPAGRVGVINHEMWPEPELGWHVFDGFEGRGYAYEAAKAARDHAGREMGLGPLISHIHPDNARSIALAERLGATFEREGILLGEPCLVYRHPKAETL